MSQGARVVLSLERSAAWDAMRSADVVRREAEIAGRLSLGSADSSAPIESAADRQSRS